jgi:hypothetical protein
MVMALIIKILIPRPNPKTTVMDILIISKIIALVGDNHKCSLNKIFLLDGKLAQTISIQILIILTADGENRWRIPQAMDTEVYGKRLENLILVLIK